jgi:hypothetical protein
MVSLLNKSTIVFQFHLVPPNQSLKLTEPAVDDFAARQRIFYGKAISAARVVYD